MALPTKYCCNAINTCINSKNTFSTSSILLKSYAIRESKFLGKMLKTPSDKKKWYNVPERTKMPTLPSATSLTKGATEGYKSSNSKRIQVLNKLFMKNITDLMATGTSSTEFLGHGIEISRVQVTPDFRGVLVYWLAKGMDTDDNIDKILSKHSGALQHELSQLKVMGVVPRIKFVKDKHYAKIIEVDLRLAKADFGEDYIPVDHKYRLKAEFTLNTQIPPDLKEEILKVDNEIEDPEEPLPPMRSDVFGLNHGEIMNKIKRSMKKSQAPHRTTDGKLDTECVPQRHISCNTTAAAYPTTREQKEAFEKFLRKRQIMEAKQNRTEKNYNPGKEFMHEQMFHADPYSNLDSIEDGDYIEDDDKK